GVKLLQEVEKVHQSILTPEAIKLLAILRRYFKPTRRSLLQLCQLQQACLDAGGLLEFNPQTSWIREDLTWQAASPAPGLRDCRLEITGPVDCKMVSNAFNSGVETYMADFE
ncbi:malate synthase, partial [Phakopsora pachyrhizi]